MDASAIDLAKILPAFMAAQADDLAFADALSAVIRLRAKRCEQIGIWDAISGMDEEVLDFAAEALGIEWWRGDWSLAEKREMLGMAEQIRCGVNSHWALEKLLQEWFGDPSLRVEEWFDYGGAPYTFRILTSSVDVQRQLRFSRIMETVQRTSQSMDGIFVGFSMRGTVHVGAKGADLRSERGEAVAYAYIPKGTEWAAGEAYFPLSEILKATSPQLDDEYVPIDDADPDGDGVFDSDLCLCFADPNGEVAAPATHDRKDRLDAAVARWWSGIGVEQDAPSIAYAWPPPQPTPAADLLTGLIGHWDFGDGTSLVMTSRGGSGWSGGTSSPNLLRKSNTTPITAGKIGGGFSAPSNGHVTIESGIGYISTGSAKYMTNTLSGGFSVWVKPSSGSLTGTKKIITATTFAPVQSQLNTGNLIVASVDGVVSVYADGFQQYNLSGGFLTEGEWSHIAVGWDASAHEISLFVDGNLVGRSDTLVLGKDTPGYFGTGRSGIGVVDGLTGLFDEVSVWSGRTITQAEVTALFNGGAGLPFEEWT